MYRVVQEKNADFPVAWMCRQLDLPRATYYRRLDASDTPTALRRRELTDQVKTVFDSSDGIFGHRMVHAKLAAAGIEVSVGTVAGIMAENGWAAKRMRAFKRTTIPSDPDKVFADLIGRDFTAQTPGTRLVGDITYLRTGEGVAVSGHRHRPVHPHDRRLGDGRPHARLPRHGRAGDGQGPRPPGPGCDLP